MDQSQMVCSEIDGQTTVDWVWSKSCNLQDHEWSFCLVLSCNAPDLEFHVSCWGWSERYIVWLLELWHWLMLVQLSLGPNRLDNSILEGIREFFFWRGDMKYMGKMMCSQKERRTWMSWPINCTLVVKKLKWRWTLNLEAKIDNAIIKKARA
jgi:hypothetical protein